MMRDQSVRDGDIDLPASPRKRFVLSRRGFGLRTRIALALALIVFALAASLSGVIGSVSVYEARQRLGTSVAVDADRLAERLNKEMAARAREIELISALGPLRDLPAYPRQKVAVEGLLDRLRRSFPAYTWIGVTDPYGRVLASTGGVLEGSDVSARASFRNSLTARPQDTTDSTQQARSLVPNDTSRVLDIVHPVLNANGTVADVVFAQIAWSWIDALASSVVAPDPDLNNPRETFIVGSDDTVLMGPGDSIGELLHLQPISRARAGYGGWTVETWPDATTYLTGASYAAGEGAYPGPGSQRMQWVTLVREPVGEAFQPANQLRNDILLLGGVLAAIFAIVGWVMAGWIAAPLARMAATAERLRQGDDVEMPLLHGAFEIESLSISLRALVASLTRKQVALDEMEALTMRDPLTGLLNRNGLRKHLERAMLHAREANITLLILLGDLDGFKQVNDVQGHAAGDAVLCEVASRLAACVRHYDAVGRFGGDEFVLVLEATSPTDATALQIARRVMEAVAAPCWIGRQAVHVGCSFGGAAWPHDGEDIDAVIAKADSALYAVKRGGKGRLLLHGEWLGNDRG